MRVSIIGQGYNTSKNSSVASLMIDLFQDSSYNSFTAVSAFASEPAILGFKTYIERAMNQGWTITMIVGIDQKGTSKQALEAILSLGVRGYVIHYNYPAATIIFHPKFYLFTGNNEYALIIGSNNLTTNGLSRNHECATLIKGKINDSVYRQFLDYWGPLVLCQEPGLLRIDSALITQLDADGYLPSENERSLQHDNSSSSVRHQQIATTFLHRGIPGLPSGFTPYSSARSMTSNRRRRSTSSNQSTQQVPQLNNGEYKVLIAEIPKSGNRWKQVNVGKSFFEDFFEYHGQVFSFDMTNIDDNGNHISTNQVSHVIVSSNNYRVETRCTETQGQYPNGAPPIVVYLKIDRTHYEFCVLRNNHPLYSQLHDLLYAKSPNPGREMKRAYSDLTELREVIPNFPLVLAHQ